MLNRINLRKIVDQISLCSLVWIPFTQIQIPTISNKNPRQCSQKNLPLINQHESYYKKANPMVSLASQQPNPIWNPCEIPQHFPKTNQTQSNAPKKTSHQPCLQIKLKNHQKKTSHWSTNINNILKTQRHGISSFSTARPQAIDIFIKSSKTLPWFLILSTILP